ncbi:MAG: ATP-binding protein [Candidatus Caenarcaniphilales bacterium]|nr:ATP-binding protein [Candidatus Caenarcaniphilales bacterium]
MEGRKRSFLAKLKSLLKEFPCVAILGARQVGKSTLLKEFLGEANFLDLEKQADLDKVEADPDFLLAKQNKTLIIDEAQICPKLFPALRVAIDAKRNEVGSFIISGSSSPELLTNISESLAGRVAIIELSTFSLEEAFSKLEVNEHLDLTNKKNILARKKAFSYKEVLDLCLYGAYPEPFLKRDRKEFYANWCESYIKTYIERDVRALFPGLKLDSYRRFIQMLASSSGDIINYAKFASSLDVSQPTIKKYFEIAEGTFLWRKLPSYHQNSAKTVIKAPKGFFRDSLLSNYFLKINDTDSLLAHPNFGQIWESFIIEQIIKVQSVTLYNTDYYYYRTKSRAEVDLIIDAPGALIPVEIKTGSSTKVSKLVALKNFIEEYNCPYGIVINNSEELDYLSEKIIQLPVNFL